MLPTEHPKNQLDILKQIVIEPEDSIQLLPNQILIVKPNGVTHVHHLDKNGVIIPGQSIVMPINKFYGRNK